jgi:hypothetical protein
VNEQLPAGAAHQMAVWARIRDTKVLPLMTKIYADMNQLVDAETRDAAGRAAGAKARYHSDRTRSIVVLAVGIGFAVALGGYVSRRIVRALARVTHVCDGLAAGDLTRTAGLTSRDEPGRMGRSLDTAVVRLRETVSTIDGSAASLAGATEQMTSTATQIAGVRRGDLGAGADGVRRRRAGLPQRRHRVIGQRTDGRLDQGNLAECQPGRAGSPPKRSASPPPRRRPWASSVSPPPRSTT